MPEHFLNPLGHLMRRVPLAEELSKHLPEHHGLHQGGWGRAGAGDFFFHLSIVRKISWTTAVVRQNISRRTQLPEARTISTAIYSLARGDIFMIR